MHVHHSTLLTRAPGRKLCAAVVAAAFCGQPCNAQGFWDRVREIHAAAKKVLPQDDKPNQVPPPPANRTSQAPPPDVAAKPPESPTELKSFGAISKSLLLFKYAPEHFTDEDLLKRTEAQIKFDQMYHKASDYVKARSPWRFSKPMFPQAIVEGRNPKFAARELVDEYRRNITEAAASLPSRFAGVLGLNSQSPAGVVRFDHEQGVLRIFPKYGEDQGHEGAYLLRPWRVPDVELDGYDVYPITMATNTNSGKGGGAFRRGLGFDIFDDEELKEKTPVSIAETTGTGYLLALDRRLELPPLSVSAEKAEQMFSQPRSIEELKNQIGHRYGEMNFFFDMEIEDVVSEGRKHIFRAHLLAATLLGMRGEILEQYDATDFPPVVSLQEEEAEAAPLADHGEKRKADKTSAARPRLNF